jgi:GTPase SAR1 family protein
MSKKNYDYLVKILLIGDSGVGKTTICHSYFDKVFINNHLQTIGMKFFFLIKY